MSRIAWRIGADTRDYQADDMSGGGARKTGGRWNDPGIAMIYASESRALSCLETIVHLNAGGLPFNRFLVEIEVPDDLWAAAEIRTPASLAVGWDAEPAGQVSMKAGSDWIIGGTSVILRVPSVIVPEEENILINPAHADAPRIRARKLRKWLYDPRLSR